MKRSLLVCLLISGCCAGGCVELAFMLGVGGRGGTGGGSAPNGGDDSPSGNGSAALPIVTLTASNPSPQANEEVLLTCAVEEESRTGSTFAFQPDDGRLTVNEQTGIAGFIPSDADLGQEFSFTCTATNEAGTGDPSNLVTIIPHATNMTSDEEPE